MLERSWKSIAHTKHITERRAREILRRKCLILKEELNISWRLKYLKKCRAQLKRRWIKEHLHALGEEQKQEPQWTEAKLKVGRAVLIKIPRNARHIGELGALKIKSLEETTWLGGTRKIEHWGALQNRERFQICLLFFTHPVWYRLLHFYRYVYACMYACMYVCKTLLNEASPIGKCWFPWRTSWHIIIYKYSPITKVHYSGVIRIIFINEWTELANLAFGRRLFHSFAPL